MVEYGILGPLTVVVDGRSLDLGGARQRAVLAVLLIHRNTVVSVDRLVDLVWGEDPPPTAETALQNQISRLRRLLGPASIETLPPGYLLRVAAGDIDVERFEALVDAARTAPSPSAGELLRDALRLWRGPALADLAYERFAEIEIARLEELHLGALELRIEADLANNRHEALAGELEALIAEHPYRERLHGHRILALYRAGRQAEALAAYHAARELLDEGLGIEPGPDLQALEIRILQQDPDLVVPRQEIHSESATSSSDDPPRQAHPGASPPASEPVQAARTRLTRKLVTVLFIDMAGSTALGEVLDPEALRGLIDRYFHIVRVVIEAHGGTIEKFIGDAVMALFGIPIVHEDDALRAVRAAIEIRAELARLDAEIRAGLGIAILFQTGINTGEVVAGDTANGGPMVTGEPVTMAAHLVRSAAPGEILLGRLTWQLVRDAVTVEPVETLRPDGKADPLPAYRLLALDRAVAGHVRRLDAPLVGREREMAALHNEFERVTSEQSSHLFTLLGTAGVGKSRLIAEFTTAVASDATILRGRCLSYGEGITYWPIAEVVRAAAGIDEADSAEAARMKLWATLDGGRDADVVAARVASAVGLSVEVAPQEEVFWAIQKLFEHLARERPLVVVIEDIHWAEPTLLDLIEHVAEWSRDAPILLLCPARPELLDARAAWSGGKLNATNVLLEPLGTEPTRRLIAALPGGNAIPAPVEARVAAAAEGNPLFVEELLGMLVDDGLLIQADDGTWTASDALADVRIPASINALLTARLERLAPNERAVAERASIVGRVFEQAAVTELATDALRPEVGQSLLALVRKELIRPDHSDLAVGEAFKFRHILIRDTAYEALPKSERAVLHERFADWLEQTVGERLAEYEVIVGYHLEAAYRYRTQLGESGPQVAALAGRAGAYFTAGGSRAFDRGDMAAAETLLSRATRAFPVGSPERLELMPDLGHALFATGRIPEAVELLRAAVIEGTVVGEAVLVARIEMEAALVQILSAGESREPRETAEASIPGLERAGDGLGLARAHLVLASSAWMTGQIATAVEERRLALDHAARIGDRRTERRNSFWGSECYGPTPAVAAIIDLEAILATSVDDPMRRARTTFSLALLYAMRDRAIDAREAYLSVRAILDELGLRIWSGASSEIGANVELLLGDPVRAEGWAADGIARLEGLGAPAYQSFLHGIRSNALASMGEFDAALEAADQCIHDSSPEDVLNFVIARTGRALALLGRGDPAAALASARAAVEGAQKTDWILYRSMALLALAECLEASGDSDGAVDAARQSLELSRAKENLPGEARAARLLDRLPPLPG